MDQKAPSPQEEPSTTKATEQIILDRMTILITIDIIKDTEVITMEPHDRNFKGTVDDVLEHVTENTDQILFMEEMLDELNQMVADGEAEYCPIENRYTLKKPGKFTGGSSEDNV